MTSELGEGTTLILVLAFRIGDPTQLRERGGSRALPSALGLSRPVPSSQEAEKEGTLVLLVDDHPTNRSVLARQLAALGYACETAPDGALALDMFGSGRFALVIADCQMPVMDGYELAQRIRLLEAQGNGKRTPILACTANASGSEVATCIAAGMDDCLTKPIELAGLGEALHRWLQLPVVAPGSDHVQEQVPLAPLDTALVAATWGGGTIVRDILATFRRFNDEDSDMLRRAVAKGDWADVTHSAHRMLGSSRMVGATDFSMVCERLLNAAQCGDPEAMRGGMQFFEVESARLNEYLQCLISPVSQGP